MGGVQEMSETGKFWSIPKAEVSCRAESPLGGLRGARMHSRKWLAWGLWGSICVQRLSSRSVWGLGDSGCQGQSGILGAGLMSWESGGGVGEFGVLGPDHPRSSGMGGLSPCSKNRGEQVPGGEGE